jgi:hypothetical protein
MSSFDQNATLADGARRAFPISGEYVYLRESTGQLSVRIIQQNTGGKDGKESAHSMRRGDKIRPGFAFDNVVITNNSGASVTFELAYGTGDFDRPIPDTVNVAVSVPTSDTFSDVADVTVAGVGNANADEISAANSDRTKIIIQAHADNDTTFRVGGSTVDTDTGVQLVAGDVIALETTAAVWACEESSGTNKVCVIELTDG